MFFPESVGQYKASWYETARNLFRSRNTQRARAEKQAEETRQLGAANELLHQELHWTAQQLDQTQQLLRQQQQETEALRQRPITLPSDLPLPHHSYGPKMISLCLNLAKEIGFRPTETALKIVFAGLGIDANVPSFDSIRVWSCRVGIAQLKLAVRDDEPWIWLADHSNQIGQEKVLQILGIRVKDLPPIGETLSRDKMVVLATVPGTSWTRDDVRREYKELAKRLGPPAYLVTDGAVELIESADALEIEGQTPIVLRDMKHYAANVFEQLIGKDERFKEYLSQLGRRGVRIEVARRRSGLVVDGEFGIVVWPIQASRRPTQQRRLHEFDRGDAHAANSLDPDQRPRKPHRRLRESHEAMAP